MVLKSSGSGGSLEVTLPFGAWNSRKGQRSTCLKLSKKRSQKGKWGKGRNSPILSRGLQNLS